MTTIAQFAQQRNREARQALQQARRDAWVECMATWPECKPEPQPVAETPARRTLLDLALEQLRSREQWYNGETITLSSKGQVQIWLKNQGGFIQMIGFKDAHRLDRRRYTRPLVIGYYDPQHCIWQESENARADYGEWSRQAKQLLS